MKHTLRNYETYAHNDNTLLMYNLQILVKNDILTHVMLAPCIIYGCI